MAENIDTSIPQEAVPAQRDLASQESIVNVYDPQTGDIGGVPKSLAPKYIAQGYALATPEQINTQIRHEDYGSNAQVAATTAEGLAKGFAGPLATGAERLAGVPGKDILARAEENPWAHGLSEATGLGLGLATGIGPLGKGLSLAGEAALHGSELVGLGGEGAGLISRAAAQGARGATEMALFGLSDEASKALANDPGQSVDTAIANVKSSALFGLVGGSVLGAVSPLWESTDGAKSGQLVADFRSRIQQHLDNPEPLEAVKDEVSNYYNNIKGMADEVYGTSGLKAQEVAKLMPEMGPKVANQVIDIANKAQETLAEMRAKPLIYPERLIAKFENDVLRYQDIISSHGATPEMMFNAMQDMKQSLQGYSKFGFFVKPVDEAYDFVQKMKGLGFDVREALENPEVWGKAGTRQLEINKAFKEYLPTLKDFEKKFTSLVNEERIIDPGKLNTYMNQLGKPSAEIKQTMLKNFIEASEKYKKVIADTHANLGLENPITPTPLNYTSQTFQKLTAGGRLADSLLKRGVSRSLGAAAGAAIGGSLGGPMGAVIGGMITSPLAEAVLPTVAKAILGSAVNSGAGMKAALDYGEKATQGYTMTNRAIKSLFKAGAVVLPSHLESTPKSREKLDKGIRHAQADPGMLIDKTAHLNHYMGEHGSILSQRMGNIVNYLNSIRPVNEKQLPLDGSRGISSVKSSEYNSALKIADQPLSIVEKIKNATINPKDVMALKGMYPGIYSLMSQKIVEEISASESKSASIPYKTRIGLSMFLGQPLDSTMTGMSIASAQPKGAQESDQGHPNKGSMKNINKLAEADRTPEQARLANKASV